MEHKIATADCSEMTRIFQAVLSPVSFGGKLLVGSAKNRQLGFCTYINISKDINEMMEQIKLRKIKMVRILSWLRQALLLT